MLKVTYDIAELSDLPPTAHRLWEDFGDFGVFLLYGELGMGKTALVQEICQILDVTGDVVSPTYTIINEYITTRGTMVYHVDLYRVKSLEEAINTGIEDYLFSGLPIFVEWPAIIEAILPLKFVKLVITEPYSGGRKIIAEPHA